jgi:multimeric flavodoxin WrbA
MKLLGLSFGTRLGPQPMGGTNEVLVKEALMAAKAMGVEVGLIHMPDLDIRPCRGCVACAMSLMAGGEGKCVINDDLTFVDEQLMASDALIARAPVYVLGPSGLVKVVTDRWGCSHDVYWRSQASRMAKAAGKKGPDERSFKHRVGAVMCTGHGTTPDWLSLGLITMNTLMYPSGVRVVDQLAVFPGAFPSLNDVPLVENETVLEKARKLGRNVATAMQLPPDQVKWMGDDQGTCPVCHLDLLMLAKKNPVQCPICGIRGELKMVGDEITVTFSEAEMERSRVRIGLKEHLEGMAKDPDAMRRRMDLFQKRANEIAKKKEKYLGYAEIAPARQ